MASQTKRKHSKAYNTEELFDLVDNLGNNNKKEEGFDKIRQWLNTNKDDNAKLKEAMTHRGQGGVTPLHVIVRRSPPLDIIEAFIKYAPEAVRILNDYQGLPIHCACGLLYDDLEIVQALVNSYPESLNVADRRGCLPLHYVCWNHNSLRIVQFLVKSCPESTRVTDSGGFLPCTRAGNVSGCLPIHYACWLVGCGSLEGNHSIVKFLVESYPESVKVKDSSGCLPLHRALRSRASLKIVSFLIDCCPEGVGESHLIPLYEGHPNPNERPTRAPLYYLVAEQYAEKQDRKGMILLHRACMRNGFSADLIRVLAEAYPQGWTVQDNSSRTPKQYLIESASRKDENGMLLLHRQAAHCEGLSVESLNILFDAYSEAIRIQDNFGLLPLHYACLNEVSTVDIIMSLVKLYPESILVRCTSD
jgi:ankyrin repeat protein